MEPPASADGEVAEEDLGVGTYEDKEIDLAAVVRDEAFLELPMSPLCSRAARIVPGCGHDLNTGPCGCAAVIDDRWQSLKRIKLKDN